MSAMGRQRPDRRDAALVRVSSAIPSIVVVGLGIRRCIFRGCQTKGSGMSGLSDYELLDLFNEYLNASAYHFMNFLTVYFAFLVTTYLIGRKLTPSMIMILIGL